MRTTSTLLGLFALLVGAVGCGSSTPGGTGTMNVHLVDAPGDYQHVLLDVREVKIHSDATGWMSLGTPNKVVDLLALQGGVAETLVDGASLPAGSYGQMRLVLGPNNSVTLNDEQGTSVPLKVPSGQQSGVKFPVNFAVAPGTTADVFIDFDAHKSIFVHAAGKSGKYMMRPVVRAVDRVVTGAVAGKLTDALSQASLAGVVVTAQTVENGVPTVLRTATTKVDGSYSLDLLPVGKPCWVVAQPVTSEASYLPQASAPITVTSDAPVRAWSAAFTRAAAVGAIAGAVTPVASDDDGDEVTIQQVFADGAQVVLPFVVRSVIPAAGPSGETYAADQLPVTATAYSVALTRRHVDANGVETSRRAGPVSTQVGAGNTSTVDFDLTP